jgi:hypothetical protein
MKGNGWERPAQITIDHLVVFGLFFADSDIAISFSLDQKQPAGDFCAPTNAIWRATKRDTSASPERVASPAKAGVKHLPVGGRLL